MRLSFRLLPLLTLWTLLACSSTQPDSLGPANERTFPYPVDKVWRAASEAVPAVWGTGVRSADRETGVMIFTPLYTTSSLTPSQWERYGRSAVGRQIKRELSLFVTSGSEGGTRVSLRIETDEPGGVSPESAEAEQDRLSRKILDAIEKELKK